jgi:tRNA pseudouridine55 synthase
VVASSEHRPTFEDVESVLLRFTGPIEQIPPAYSAIKIDGKRAYDRARAGEEVEMTARSITVHNLTIRHAELVSASIVQHAPTVDAEKWTLKQVQGDAPLSSVTLSANVSKGTYIRSLARDIAYAVGTVGHVAMLRRSKAGPFTLENAISLDNLNAIGQGAALEDILLPMEAGLDDIPALDLSPEQAGAIRQGRVLTGIATKDGQYWARDAEMQPVALIELIAGTLKIVRGFNL